MSNLFPVYPLYDIEPVKAIGATITDKSGQEYLDFYGGHAVISIGHSHPYYIEKIKAQLDKIGFYSNAVVNNLQEELAEKLLDLSGLSGYSLFLCNSGAEANENAMKVAGFATGRKKVVAFTGGFHGRTSLAVAATDNDKILSPVNLNDNILRLEMNSVNDLEDYLDDTVACVILEHLQGVAGIVGLTGMFIERLYELCAKYGIKIIADEVQSGYGRTGKFFAYQHYKKQPDIISMAKGMGNGFPIGGILIKNDIEAFSGMLGTTFGGNHLACAAGIAVLDVLKEEKLIENAKAMGAKLRSYLDTLESYEFKGLGLMLGIDFKEPIAPMRKELIYKHHIFTGSAKNPNTLRLLPPLCIDESHILQLMEALQIYLR